MGYYVVKFIANTVILQEDIMKYGKVFKAVEFAFKIAYLIII